MCVFFLGRGLGHGGRHALAAEAAVGHVGRQYAKIAREMPLGGYLVNESHASAVAGGGMPVFKVDVPANVPVWGCDRVSSGARLSF